MIVEQGPVIVPIKQVCARVGMARHTVLKLIREGRFPRPLYPAPRMPRWRTDEIDEWLERLSTERATN